MTTYLTFGDLYSGVYQSQVIDVLHYINSSKISDKKIKLVAYVPYVLLKDQKVKIKSKYPDAVILPMIPSRNHWSYFSLLTLVLSSPRTLLSRKLICRGIWAGNLGLLVRRIGLSQFVCYDGRGAAFAEWKEYLGKEINVDYQKILHAEKKAVIKSDYRIAVSQKLTEYWKENFDYSEKKHSVIPCTLAQSFLEYITDDQRNMFRKELGYKKEDTVVVFAGGIDKWQSVVSLVNVMKQVIAVNKNVKFLFLSKPEIFENKQLNDLSSVIQQFWVEPSDVKKYLSAGDFGLLIREKSTTNKVAAPTKFAEYLACGLTVLISECVGDYTDFVKDQNCGQIIETGSNFKIYKKDRNEMYKLAVRNFSKNFYQSDYREIYN